MPIAPATESDLDGGGSQPPSARLCAVCDALDFKKFSEPCEKTLFNRRLSCAQPHQPSFGSLVSSAETCILCAHFLHIYVHCPKRPRRGGTVSEHDKKVYEDEIREDERHSKSQKLAKKIREKPWWWDPDIGAWPFEVRSSQWPPLGLENVLGAFTVRGVIVGDFHGNQRLYGLTLQRMVVTSKGKLWTDCDPSYNWTNLSCISDDIPWIAGRPPTSESAASLAIKWVSDCSTNHVSCGPLKDTEMPTRVIDVGAEGQQEPKLIETHGRSGQWATLSYPWGEAEPVTTKSTYHDHLREMPLASLPPMFQDAIRVVRDMGIQYLWIDSICIIQGDESDWATECSQMTKVYKNSALTIAARAASSPSDVLILPRNPVNARVCTFEKDGVEFILNMDAETEHEDTSPIATRAWCFQERLLPPRVLYLGGKQPYLECSKCYYFDFLRIPFPLNEQKLPTSQAGKVAQSIAKSIFAKDIPYDTGSWLKMVEFYSLCNLTKFNDKLPALSGLAQAVAERTEDTYLAGAWLSKLCEGLCWYCEQGGEETSNPVTEYRAPSWSWASVDGSLRFLENASHGLSDIEVISAMTTPATEDKFGRVSCGMITLLGHVLILKLTPSARHLETQNYDENNPKLTLDYFPDRPNGVRKGGRKIPCLLLGGVHNGFYGLALEEVEGRPQTFRRIGFIYNSAWLFERRLAEWWRERLLKKWQKVEEQTVHLI